MLNLPCTVDLLALAFLHRVFGVTLVLKRNESKCAFHIASFKGSILAEHVLGEG